MIESISITNYFRETIFDYLYIELLVITSTTKFYQLTLQYDSLNVVKLRVDASFVAHPDMKIHTGGCMSLGKGEVYRTSRKQKINLNIPRQTGLQFQRLCGTYGRRTDRGPPAVRNHWDALRRSSLCDIPPTKLAPLRPHGERNQKSPPCRDNKRL